jgi:hypothetical protein
VVTPPDGPCTEFDLRVAAAIATRFDGDAALYRAFAASCMVQFALDAAAGQLACEASDLAGLGKLGHNLKSALYLLGHDGLSDLAAHVEVQAAAGDLPSACQSWHSLQPDLLRLKAP